MNRPLQIVNEQNWERFSATERIGRSAFYIVTVLAFVWALKKIEVIPEFLYDAPEQTADLLRECGLLIGSFTQTIFTQP